MNPHAYLPRIASVVLSLATLATSVPSVAQQAKAAAPTKRNVIIFVADGLRHDSVNIYDSPLMLAVRTFGVHFSNSHSLFPTFTTANAASIATGHYLGDTGDFSNTIYEGQPLYESGNFGFAPGTQTPFLENDEVLADFNSNYGGDYLNEETLLQLARKSLTIHSLQNRPEQVGNEEATRPDERRAPKDDSTEFAHLTASRSIVRRADLSGSEPRRNRVGHNEAHGDECSRDAECPDLMAREANQPRSRREQRCDRCS